MIWVIPQRTKLPTWLLFGKVFTTEELLKLSIAYFMLVVLWSLTKGSTFFGGLFTVSKLFLFQSVKDLNSVSKIALFVTGSFLVLHISYIFSSRLFSLLTTPVYYPSPSNIEELANVEAPFYYGEEVSAALRATNIVLWEQFEKKRQKDFVGYSELFRRSLNDSLVFKVNSLILNFATHPDDLQILPQRVSVHQNLAGHYCCFTDKRLSPDVTLEETLGHR